MFYGSTVEHRQGSMISDPHESRSAINFMQENSLLYFGIELILRTMFSHNENLFRQFLIVVARLASLQKLLKGK